MDLKDYQQYIKVLQESGLNVPDDFPKELFNDKVFIKLAFYYIPYQDLLPLLPDEIREDKEIVIEVVKKDGSVFDNYYIYYNDKEVMMAAVSNYGLALDDASDELKADKELVMEAVRHPLVEVYNNHSPLECASDELKHDKEVIKEAVKYSAYALDCIPDELFADEDFVRELIRVNPTIYEQERMNEYLADRNMIQAFIDAGVNLKILRYLPEEFADDKELVKSLIKNCDKDAYTLFQCFASERLQNDIELVLLAFEQEGEKERSIEIDTQEMPDFNDEDVYCNY